MMWRVMWRMKATREIYCKDKYGGDDTQRGHRYCVHADGRLEHLDKNIAAIS